jgi:hypothetical protein
MQFKVNPFHFLIITFIGIILFMPFIGAVHLFDWDEINFAESAREMMVTGNYSKVQINYTPFWEKPPLFIWMQVVSMKMFGVNAFAARFPNAVFGIVTLCYIYYVSRRIFKGHLAHWWVLCYIGAITPHFYFKTGLIDPVFNLFIFASIIQFYWAAKNYHVTYNCNRNFMWAGILTGIAILAKGPVAFLIGILVLFTLVVAKRMVWFFKFKHLVIYGFFALLVTSIWFLPETLVNGPWFIVEFINYQLGLFSQNIAGHQQPFYYHVLVLLVGCFPISLIAIWGWKKNEYYIYPENLFRLVMMCLFWVVLILFSIVKTKIVHYSSLCWLPLTFMAAYAIESFNNRVFRFRWFATVSVIVFGILISAALIALPVIMVNPELKLNFINAIKDEFSKQNFMVDGGWHYADILPGVLLITTIAVFAVLAFKKHTVQAFGSLLIGNVVVVFLAAVMLVPKIERHTQGTAIRYFESLKGKDVYLFHVGYKSYAPYFYGQTQPLKAGDGLNLLNYRFLKQRKMQSIYHLSEPERAELDDYQKKWMMEVAIDKPVYFIAKINDQEELPEGKQLIKLEEKGGFIMYRRDLPKH